MRRLPTILGLVVLAAAWAGPLPQLARRSFTAHMTLHMAVVAVAAGLLALGLAGGRFDLARRMPRLFAPIPASIAEAVVVWAWHAPLLHRSARHDWGVFALEQASFLAVGVFLWLSAFGGDRRLGSGHTGRMAAGIVGLLLTSMHMTLLGALLALTPRPLFFAAHPAGDAGRMAGGLSPLADQHLGGAVMLLVGAVTYLAGGLWLTAGVLRGAPAVTGGRS